MVRNPLAECYQAAQERLAERLQAAQAKGGSPQEMAYHLLAVYDTACAEALEHRQLYPYAFLARAFLHKLQKALSPNKGSDSVSTFGIFLVPPLSRLERYVQRFSRLQHVAERHIQLQVIPSAFDGRKIFLPSGKVIIPTEIPKGVGYHAYALFHALPAKEPILEPSEGREEAAVQAEPERDRLLVDVEQLTDIPCFSLDDALDRHTNPREWCTLAFAQNAEYFPLVETALPIVVNKYEKALFPSEEVSG